MAHKKITIEYPLTTKSPNIVWEMISTSSGLQKWMADYVTAWSKGGATDIDNCQMLCKTHNRAKGNK